MRPARYFVSSVAEGWDVLPPQGKPRRFRNRLEALMAAQHDAEELWNVHRAAAEVLVNEQGGEWRLVRSFGQLLDS